MKKLLPFLFLLMFATFSYAQQIAVKSFRQLENDLDARAYYPKEDRNGEKAAIIKIVTNETGFEFDAGSIGIVASVQKTGEIWLYVPRGSKAVTIKHPKFTLLRNYAYPQSIGAGEVYEMILTTGRVVTTIEEPVIETQWLLITTDPSSADVYINDQPAGKTPYANELPFGKYTWRVSKELYLPESGFANLISGGEKQVMKVKMKPDFGTLSISSIPENGAMVSLNGIETGKVTPCTIEKVPSGDHSITINRDMYETTSRRLTLAAGETKQVAVTMNPTFAQVTVTSEPAADIYINGQLKSKTTWQGRLNPGVYTFEAKLEKHTTASEKQTVIVGQPLNIKLTPVPRTGNIKVMSSPFEATIKIDGKDMGQTPFTLKNLLIGDYTVELSLTGYATAYEKVTITEGVTAQINAILQNGMQVEITSNPTGADLFIDDKPAGKTPYTGNLSFGNHKIRIENNGKKAEKDVQISQGGTAVFTLAITSNYTETTSGLNLEMVFVQGGTFRMGSNENTEEKPVHPVTLSDFLIGKYEVTQKQWYDVTGNDPSNFMNCDNCPVEQVSWNDIQEFIQKLNQKTGKIYRLPTEAEWEYAAKGGNKSIGYTYSGSNTIGDVAWQSDNSGSKTHPVGQKQPNEIGIYDMSGNVWEWCSDWYGSDYYQSSPTSNPQGPSSGSNRVVRGGCWHYVAGFCRVARRINNAPGNGSSNFGFRLVLVP